jgi:hypothetical protein
MPKGPKGERRPSDVVGTAIKVAKIATGEEKENTPSKTRKGGLKGGKARARALTPEERSEIARLAAVARWKKSN